MHTRAKVLQCNILFFFFFNAAFFSDEAVLARTAIRFKFIMAREALWEFPSK